MFASMPNCQWTWLYNSQSFYNIIAILCRSIDIYCADITNLIKMAAHMKEWLTRKLQTFEEIVFSCNWGGGGELLSKKINIWGHFLKILSLLHTIIPAWDPIFEEFAKALNMNIQTCPGPTLTRARESSGPLGMVPSVKMFPSSITCQTHHSETGTKCPDFCLDSEEQWIILPSLVFKTALFTVIIIIKSAPSTANS